MAQGPSSRSFCADLTPSPVPIPNASAVPPPTIAPAWRRQWTQVIPFFVHPVEIRRILYTTNAIESLNMQLRKVIKTRGHFPNDEATLKLLYLVLRNIISRWRAAPRDWKKAMTQFAILYPDRFTPEG